jgi:hypothetical protein
MSRRLVSVGPYALTAILIALIGAGAVVQYRRAHPIATAASAPGRPDAIEYLVAEAEWPGPQDPTYCEIVRRFEIPRGEVIATLQVNGGSRGCVEGSSTVPRGQRIWIAIEPAEPGVCAPDVGTCQ